MEAVTAKPELPSDVGILMEDTRHFLNGLKLVPRRAPSFADAILLGLLSKSIVLTEAVLKLVETGFFDEAFSLSRTSVEVRLIVRYLTNNDSYQRTKRYTFYFAKAKTKWREIYRKYYPIRGVRLTPDADEQRLSDAYPSPNKWAKDELSFFASEKDSFETRDDGTAVTESFTYEAVYRWMSYYVHATEPGIEEGHITIPGNCFEVHSGQGKRHLGTLAIAMAYQGVYLNLIRVLRYVNYDFPEGLRNDYTTLMTARRD